MKQLSRLIATNLFSTLAVMPLNAGASSDQQPAEFEQIAHAIELYSKAITLDPFSQHKKSLLDQSESILLNVIAEHPASLDAHRKLIGVYLQMRDYRKAIRVMQDAISLAPDDPRLFIALAILYDHQGAYEYALPILDEALALDPTEQLALDYRRDIQHKIELRKSSMQASTPPHRITQPDSN